MLHRAKHHVSILTSNRKIVPRAKQTRTNFFFFPCPFSSPHLSPYPVSQMYPRGFKTKIYVPIVRGEGEGEVAVCSWLRNEIFAETERKIAIEICGAFRLTDSESILFCVWVFFFFYFERIASCTPRSTGATCNNLLIVMLAGIFVTMAPLF